jgi:hypothetical protein
VPIQEHLVVSTCISHFCPNLTFKQGYDLPYINIFMQKQELPEVAMFVYRLGPQELSLWRTFQRCFLPSEQKTWTPWAILVSAWLKFEKSFLAQ